MSFQFFYIGSHLSMMQIPSKWFETVIENPIMWWCEIIGHGQTRLSKRGIIKAWAQPGSSAKSK
jgi:hypothetical protein